MDTSQSQGETVAATQNPGAVPSASENHDFDGQVVSVADKNAISEVSTEPINVGVSALPPQVFYIVITELCERYSYYGMRSILVIYFTDKLGYSESTAKSIYAYLMAFAYTMPLIGGALADSKLGKFRTIFLCAILYIIGAATLSLWNTSVGAFLGMFFICVGTGGIKPNISSFGGDQIEASNTALRNTFFNMFYFSINVGSVASTIITPTLKSKAGFRYAFMVPAVMLCIALVIFTLGRRLYRELPPQGSVLVRVIQIIRSALKHGKAKDGPTESSSLITMNSETAYDRSDNSDPSVSPAVGAPDQVTPADVAVNASASSEEDLEENRNWLDAARAEFPANEVNDVKQVWRLLPIFAFLPVFWTLFDQQGSTWSLQAKQLDRHIFNFNLQPSQIQVLNPLLIVLFVPLAQGVIYPFLRRRGYALSPLNRMIVGMILTALSFCSAGAVDLLIAAHGKNSVRFYVQIPQYVLISSAEILVSTTGLEFAYSQAPESMKSTVTSVYLLTVALGDTIAGTIFASTDVKPAIISFVCAGLMLLNSFVFSFITRNYKFAPGTHPEDQLRLFQQSEAEAALRNNNAAQPLLTEVPSDAAESPSRK